MQKGVSVFRHLFIFYLSQYFFILITCNRNLYAQIYGLTSAILNSIIVCEQTIIEEQSMKGSCM